MVHPVCYHKKGKNIERTHCAAFNHDPYACNGCNNPTGRCLRCLKLVDGKRSEGAFHLRLDDTFTEPFAIVCHPFVL